jgi:fluoride exporter
MTLILVGIGGLLGAVSRYLVDGWVARLTAASFPWGTLVINVSGSLVLGFLFALSVERGVLPSEIRPAVLIGFIGAYTTFSTWMLESWRLVEDGSYLAAFANVAGSVVLGVAAVVLGLVLGRIA